MKKKLSNRRLDYDAKFNKLNKSKKEKPAMQVEVTALQTKYEETISDLEQLMRKIKSIEVSATYYNYII